MRRSAFPVAIAVLVLLGCKQEAAPPAQQQAETPPPGPAPGTPEWKIQNAMSAAPAAIASQAAVMDWPATPDGQPSELRKGTNGWACFPDTPGTPGNDPMCLDGVWQAWAAAWMAHKPFITKVAGIGYMLQGGASASNTDPFKMQPDSGEAWHMEPPHLMWISPNAAAIDQMSTDPSYGGPWVMWKGTPYAHVMMPANQ